jgi:preprotein translocase subunit SecD
MLDFPLWKKALIWGVCLLGVLFASPNLFYERAERYNDALVLEENGEQANAEDLAAWPSFYPSSLLNLGLDLRGGAHLLVEVELETVHEDLVESMWPEVRDALRDIRDDVGTIRRQDSAADELVVKIGNPDAIDQAVNAVFQLTTPIQSLTGVGARNFDVSSSGDTITLTLSDAELTAANNRTMLQSLEIIRRRVDEAGTREPTIQRQGERRILIQVPGIGSAEELLDLIGRTAKLTFHPVRGTTGDANQRPGTGNILLPSVDVADEGIFYILEKRPVISGEDLVDASPSFDQNGRPAVNFRLNPSGGRIFGEYTAQNIGSPFAIVLDEEVISAPVIQSHIPGGSGIITGDFDVAESTQLAILLRAGALPAEIEVLEQRTVGPELGQDSIDAGRIASLVAFTAVLIFMVLTYGRFGIYADVALILNVCLIFALLSLIGATLTLPGIAGIVLTIGMAVDANVLIFERIREELKSSKGTARAIQQGYERALSAIIDANITTFIAAVILFVMGSGPVRGFAVTLGLGILTSVFTAYFVTRLMIVTWFERKRPKTIEV